MSSMSAARSMSPASGSGAAARADGFVVEDFVRGFLHQHVLGHFQHNRARRAGAQVGEGAAHNGRNVLDAGHGALPLDETVEDTGRHFLLNLAAHAAQGMLSHQQQHRNVVGVSSGDAGKGVGGAWAGAGQRYAHLSGGAGIAVGDFHAHALVAGGEDGYLLRGPQGRPEGGFTAAGETGDVSDSFFFQSVDYCVAASHGRSPAVAFMSSRIGGMIRLPLVVVKNNTTEKPRGTSLTLIWGGGIIRIAGRAGMPPFPYSSKIIGNARTS